VITLADLLRHFQQGELVRGNTRIAYSTRKAYEGYLRKWIEPRWGEYRLFEIRAVEVESTPTRLLCFSRSVVWRRKEQ
jgi:hypothetical protein